MNKDIRMLICFFMFITAMVFTIGMTIVIMTYNIQLYSIGVLVLSVIPVSLFAGAIGILIHEW